MLQPHIKAGSIKEPTDLIRFSWEQPKLDVGEFIRNNIELYDRIFPNKLNE